MANFRADILFSNNFMICIKPAYTLVFPNLNHIQKAWKKRNQSCLAQIGGVTGVCPRLLQNSWRAHFAPNKKFSFKGFNLRLPQFWANSCICQYPQGSLSLHFLHPFTSSLEREPLRYFRLGLRFFWIFEKSGKNQATDLAVSYHFGGSVPPKMAQDGPGLPQE